MMRSSRVSQELGAERSGEGGGRCLCFARLCKELVLYPALVGNDGALARTACAMIYWRRECTSAARTSGSNSQMPVPFFVLRYGLSKPLTTPTQSAATHNHSIFNAWIPRGTP